MIASKAVSPHTAAPHRAARAFAIGILAFIVASRWPLAPPYLYYFDSTNFALSLEQFNPALHQPQPPGYALFVALIRIIHLLVSRPEQVLFVAGLLAACASAILILVLGRELFGRAAGLFAMALLASNPVVWFAGITNQVRVFLALTAIAVALLAWRAVTRPESPGWLYAAFAALGIGAGFRPEAAVVMAPLLLWTWIRTGCSFRRLALAVLSLAAAALPWIGVTIHAVGGWRIMLRVLHDYSDAQFSDSSALYGARGSAALHMVAEAVVWNGLAVLVWIWAVPAIRRQLPAVITRLKAEFLLVWFVPPFLFSAIVHIGAPGHALASIPPLILAGSAVLAAGVSRWGPRGVLAAVIAVMAAQTLLFFKPPSRLARAASYKQARDVDRLISGTMAAIRAAQADGPVTIVHYGSSVSSRQLYYYFPDDYVDILPRSNKRTDLQWPTAYYQRKILPLPAGTGGLIRPGSHKIICLLPPNAPPDSMPGWHSFGLIFFREIQLNQQITIGPYHLMPAHP